ncbi:MAG TPA: hypothetical protein VMJ74_09075 [Pseudomonadales bacterium]|nr:hypothetical protein [Pseudomonadales bacterium]
MNDTTSDKLDSLIARLPQTIEPSRDLWPYVDARITVRAPRAPVWQLALAAGIAAAFVSALFLGVPRESETTRTFAYRQQLDAAYAPLRQASLTRYRARADRLDPALRRTVETNLAIIDRALAEIRVALERNPDDADLGQILKRTYEQELAIIDAVTPPNPSPAPQQYRGAL